MTHAHADARTIKEFLSGKVGIDVRVIETTDSTNTLCRSISLRDTPLLIAAREQTAGRGRFDRRFDSRKDAGLYMSIAFAPRCVSSPAVITAAAGVAVCLAIQRQTDVLPKIKWVNDVYIDGLKLAGILAEGVVEGGVISRAIVGIGVNVKDRPFPEEIANIATSIESATGKSVDVNRLCADITEFFFSLVANKTRTMELYKQLSCVIGRRVTVKVGDGSYEALATDVDGEGNLAVQTEDGRTILLCSGEISVRLKN